MIEYTNDFEDSSRNGEFTGNGFDIRLESGFDNMAIHSTHPHVNSIDLIYTLTQPIRIKGQQFLRYNDVAIIEPGEPGSVFGDNDFWDFVIVEGSTDGDTWTALLDGYDARTNEGWLNAYNQGSPGRSSLFAPQQIDLSEFFVKDDIILLRFRLTADAAVVGWGWAIDDVNVILDNTCLLYTSPSPRD